MHREDLKPAEKEAYIVRLYKILGENELEVARKTGFSQPSVHQYRIAHEHRTQIAMHIAKSLPEDTSSSDLVVTRDLGITEARYQDRKV